MGYMGLGMQSWIYKRRPRKPFSKRGVIPSCSPLPKYSITFIISPLIKESKYKYALWGLISFLSLLFLISVYTNKFTLYSNNYSSEITENYKKMDNEAFSFLLNSGKNRLLSNHIIGAYSEFNLAYKIKPEDKELNQILIETLSTLCFNDITYCGELNKMLNKGINAN